MIKSNEWFLSLFFFAGKMWMPCDLYLCSALYALAGMIFFSIMVILNFDKTVWII
jgi:hypothetical protein